MAGIYFDARINGEQLQRDIADINKQLKNLTTDVEKTGRGIDSTFKNLGGLLAGYFTFNFAGNMVKQIAQVRGEFQQLEVAFETMIGNKARADALMADVVRMASTTPFELKEVASGAKSLLAFGISTEDIIPTLKSLGDVSAGLSVPMERLILNFGQIKTQSKLTGKELRDFNVAGVPIIAELAKNLGKSEQAIQDMVSAGNIGFQEVADAFKSMSSEGGRFANLMDKQAKTIIGLQSNLRDAIDQMFNSIGQSQEGAISSVLKTAISLVENYEKVIDILKVLVVTYGAYKAALMTVAAWQTISTKYAVMDIATKKLQIGATLKAAAAQSTLNTAMKLNPYVLAAAGIAAFITILTTSIKKKREAAQASAEFADSLETETYNVNKAFTAIKNTTEGTKERADAIKAVNQQYGTYLPNLLTEASTLAEVAAAQRDVTKAIIETIDTKYKEAALAPQMEAVERTSTAYSENVNTAIEKVISGINKGKVKGQLRNLLNETIQRALIQGGDVDVEAVKSRIEYIFKAYGDGVKLGTVQLANLVGSIYSTARANENLRQSVNEIDIQTKAYLRTLGLTDTQIGTTGEQIQSTVKDQIKSTTQAITVAKAELDKLRAPASVATTDQIKAQEDIIKELEGKLSTLTGISKKAAKDQLKVEDDKIKAQQEIAKRMLDLEIQTQAERVAIIEEGTRKQIAEIDTQLNQEIDAIERQRAELIKAAKSSTDYESQAKVIDTNSDIQITEANKAAADKRIQIEQNAASKVSELWSTVTDRFEADQQRQVEAINKKYDSQIAAAKKNGDEIAQMMLSAEKDDLINYVAAKYATQRINIEEQVALRRIELQNDITVSEIDLEEQRLSTYKKFAQMRIDELSRANKEENAGKIAAEIEYIGKLDDAIKSLNTTRVSSAKIAAQSWNEADAQLKTHMQVLSDVENAMRSFTSAMEDSSSQQVKAELAKIAGIESAAKKEVSIVRELQSDKIAEIEAGKAAALKASEKAYQAELILLKENRRQYSELYGDLPDASAALYDDREKALQQKYISDKIAIEKDAADRVTALWDSAADQFTASKDRELAYVRKYYDILIEEAAKAGNKEKELLLRSESEVAMQKVNTAYFLDRIAMEEEVAMRRIELQKETYATEQDVEKERLAMMRKYAEQRLSYLSDTKGNDAMINGLRDYIAQIDKALQTISTSESGFGGMWSSSMVDTARLIKEQKQLIEDLENSTRSYTGSMKEAVEEQLKAEQEKLKRLQSYAQIEVDLINNTNAARIAAMEDGTQMQLARLEVEYKAQINAINTQRQAQLDAYNEVRKSQGLGGTSSLSTSDEENYKQWLLYTDKKYANDKIKIEQESAAKVKELWKVVTDEFSSDHERELTSVREYYAERIAEAQKAADKELEINLRSAQQYAEQKIDQQYYADVLEAESDVIREKMKMREKDFADSESYRKAEYNAIVKWAQKQIAFYQKLGGKESEGPIKALLEFMNGLKQSSDESEGALGKIEQGFMRIRRAIDYVDEGLGKSLDSMFEIGKATEKLNSLLSVEGKKDWFGISMAGADIIMGVFDMMSSTIAETIGSSQTMGQKLDKINNTLSMQQQILSNISGNDYWALMTKQVDEYDKKVKLSTQAIIAGINSFEFKALNLGKDIPSDIINWDLYEILEAHNKGIITLTQAQLNYLNEGIDAMTAQMDLMETSWEKITGTTRDSIADGIIEGFRDGFDSAEDFADNLEELLKKAILTAVKTDIMKGPLTQWYQQLGELSKDGLTDDELKILKDSWDKLIAASKQIYDDIEKATGVQLEIKPEDETVSDRNKITGAVKGITEETAGIIAGQFYAMRENLLAIKNDTNLIRGLIPLDLTYSFTTIRDNAVLTSNTLSTMNTTQQQMAETGLNQLAAINETVGHLAQIEKNTRNNEKLNSIDARLEELNRNIKNL